MLVFKPEPQYPTIIDDVGFILGGDKDNSSKDNADLYTEEKTRPEVSEVDPQK